MVKEIGYIFKEKGYLPILKRICIYIPLLLVVTYAMEKLVGQNAGKYYLITGCIFLLIMAIIFTVSERRNEEKNSSRKVQLFKMAMAFPEVGEYNLKCELLNNTTKLEILEKKLDLMKSISFAPVIALVIPIIMKIIGKLHETGKQGDLVYQFNITAFFILLYLALMYLAWVVLNYEKYKYYKKDKLYIEENYAFM
jgi:hypothetical protein